MDKTEENLWRITSSSKEYTIKKTNISCDVTCNPKCIRCGICSHIFAWDCYDFRKTETIRIHIHFVCIVENYDLFNIETNQSSNDKRLNCDKKLTPQK